MSNHETTVTETPRPKAGAHDTTCKCGWGSYGHDTRADAQAHGKQHETRNR